MYLIEFIISCLVSVFIALLVSSELQMAFQIVPAWTHGSLTPLLSKCQKAQQWMSSVDVASNFSPEIRTSILSSGFPLVPEFLFGQSFVLFIDLDLYNVKNAEIRPFVPTFFGFSNSSFPADADLISCFKFSLSRFLFLAEILLWKTFILIVASELWLSENAEMLSAFKNI